MRVLQIVQYFETGGLEQMVYMLAKGLIKSGVECHVLAYVRDGALRERFRSSGIRTFFCRGRSNLRYELPWVVYQRLKAGKYDVVHSHHLGPLIYSAAPAAILGVPHIHTEHSLEFYDTPRRRIMARVLSMRTRLVGVSSQIASWHRDNLGLHPEIIENGVELPAVVDARSKATGRESFGLDTGAFVVGCVARLATEKSLDVLLKAFSMLTARGRKVTLVVVGDGPERQALEALAGELGIDRDVRWMGNRDDVYDILRTFDVIALSSAREGLPLSLLEGMAHGLPAVATAVGGIPLLLKDGGGRVVPTGQPQKLAEALQFYLDNNSQRMADGRLARELIGANYSVEQMIERYVQLYEQTVREGGDRRWTGLSLATILGRTRRPPNTWR